MPKPEGVAALPDDVAGVVTGERGRGGGVLRGRVDGGRRGRGRAGRSRVRSGDPEVVHVVDELVGGLEQDDRAPDAHGDRAGGHQSAEQGGLGVGGGALAGASPPDEPEDQADDAADQGGPEEERDDPTDHTADPEDQGGDPEAVTRLRGRRLEAPPGRRGPLLGDLRLLARWELRLLPDRRDLRLLRALRPVV